MSAATHYLSVALRSIARNRLYAAIGIGGLAIGFAAAILIGIHVHDELTYDRWIPDHRRIFQISAGTAQGTTSGAAPSDLGPWLELDFPQIEAVARLFPAPGFLRHEERTFNETILWADASVFDVFRLPVAAGSLDGALSRPDSLVLSRETATKYFGRADAVGETLLFDGRHPMQVTAIIEDLPSNTHLDVDVLAAGHAAYSPAAVQDLSPLTGFGSKLWNSRTYFRLPAEVSVEEIRRGVPEMLDRRAPGDGSRKTSEIYLALIRPIADIHLSPGLPNGPPSDRSRLYAAGAVGALILLAAMINFVNLLTTLGARRAVEVGVRKAAGGKRRDLFAQFMTESFLCVALSAAAGLAIAAAALPRLNAFLLKPMDFEIVTNPGLALAGVALLALTALLAGFYPAAVLSSFRPAVVMSARAAGGGIVRVRQALVVVQFAILIGLLVATITVHRQTSFGVREALRQNTDPIVVVRAACADAMLARMREVPGVREAACTQALPQWGSNLRSPIRARDREQGFSIRYLAVGFGFFELYGYRPVAGRLFSAAIGTDASPEDNVWTYPEALVVNEAAARELGFASPEDAVGQIVSFRHLFRLPSTFTPRHDAEIIGVVEDFQMGPVRSDIMPAAFFVHEEQLQYLSAKLDGGRVPEALRAIDDIWSEMGTGGPVQRFFFDESIENMYQDMRRQAQLLGTFAGIAILIAVLGLVGLTAEVAARRRKEIGIRKALGASRASVVRLLAWQFSRPVLAANAIAWPLAYVAMSAWLEGFARRVELEAWVFFTAAAAALTVALATASVQVFAMAGSRPVTALRCE